MGKEMRDEFVELKRRNFFGDIKENECVNCGEKAHDFHHIVPLVVGGTNKKSNVVALCTKSAGNKCIPHGKLVSLGLEEAKKNGKQLGRPKMTTIFDIPIDVRRCFMDKRNNTHTAKITGISRPTIIRYRKIWDGKK